MWIYEQTKSEENFSLLPQTVGLPVQTAESALPPVPAQAAEPAEQLTQKEPCIPAKRHATQDCWLLAAAFLVGCTAAGVLQAVCDARQTELLQYYLEAWQRLFAPGSMQGAVQLFGMEYLTLGLVVSLFLVLGLSALGPVMIFGNMMLYGLGSGLLMVQLCTAGGWKAILPALLWTGLPAARIHAYSFRKHPGGQARPGVQALLGQYLLTMVVLLPLCGAAAGLSYLGSRL